MLTYADGRINQERVPDASLSKPSGRGRLPLHPHFPMVVSETSFLCPRRAGRRLWLLPPKRREVIARLLASSGWSLRWRSLKA